MLKLRLGILRHDIKEVLLTARRVNQVLNIMHRNYDALMKLGKHMSATVQILLTLAWSRRMD